MVTSTDPTLFTSQLSPSSELGDHRSGLSRARLYLRLPTRAEDAANGADHASPAVQLPPCTPTTPSHANRLRSVSNGDASSLRSYPSLPSLDSDHGTDHGGAVAIASPVSLSTQQQQKPAIHLQPWEWELSRGGFIPSPLPSPSIPDDHGSVGVGGSSFSNKSPSNKSPSSGSKTDAFFATSFKQSLPTPPKPLKVSTTDLGENDSPSPSPTTAIGHGSSTFVSSSSGRDAQLDGLGLHSHHDVAARSPFASRMPSEEASLARARSLGESSKAARSRARGGATTTQSGRSNAFFNTSFVAYPPGILEGVPTPTMTRTTTLQSDAASTPKLLPSTLEQRQPFRAVSTPVKPLDRDANMDNLSIEDGADREMTMRSRMTRERSNGQVPTASRTALGRRSFSEVSRSALHTGDVLVAEDAAEDEEGEQSAWKVESILGEGAFSTVWSGKQVVRRLKGKAREEPQAEIWEAEDAERSVAIKVMDKRICRENDRTRISFVREVEVLKRISHPNVVNYLSSFSTCSHHCLVLEKVSGGELFELLQRPGYHAKMGEDFVRRVFGELARCVGWLHEAGVVHRDLKLENILFTVNPFDLPLTAGGQIPVDRLPAFPAPLIKLTDFGLARFIDFDRPLLQTRCGSESFAAPEIVMGQPYDGRNTDSWACGVILYALLTGELPFDRPTSAATVDGESHGERRRRMMRIAKGHYDWPGSGTWSCDAQQVVGALLQRDPARRTRVGKALWDGHAWMSQAGGVPAPADGEAQGDVKQQLSDHPGRRILDGWLLDEGVGTMARAEVA